MFENQKKIRNFVIIKYVMINKERSNPNTDF